MPLTVFDAEDATEPVTLALAKVQCKLPSATGPEDELIEQVYIPAARQRCEAATRRQLREVTFDLVLDAFPEAPFVEMPRPPLIDVEHVKYLDSAGALQTLVADTDYVVQVFAGDKPKRGRIALASGKTWPTTLDQAGAVTIRFRCGHGAEDGPDVPAVLVAAMLKDVATLYAAREDSADPEIPEYSSRIYRLWRSVPTQVLPEMVAQ